MSSPLEGFRRHNPEATVEYSDSEITIANPWGDDSLAFALTVQDTEAMDALNSVRLPPRFTALWHRDTQDLEFIFGIVRRDLDLRTRTFCFRYCGIDYRCEYADASQRLVVLGRISNPSGPPSSTDQRNLSVVRSWLRLHRGRGGEAFARDHTLTSFYIRNFTLDEERAVLLARHLNFYMPYYDRKTPLILIHDDEPAAPLKPDLRFPQGLFPDTLVSRNLDPYLLGLWDSVIYAPDAVRRFTHAFQILEYAAFYFVKEDIERSVRRLVASPNLPTMVDDATRQLLDVVSEDKLGDEQKMDNVVHRTVDPSHIWPEIKHREDFFSQPTVFEGGYSVPELIRTDWELDDFRPAWHPKVVATLRNIRNALVHAREKRQARTIPPTRTNQVRLRPWASLAMAVAAEVIQYDI